jgi:GNAT superfamily N-acetyltransferase
MSMPLKSSQIVPLWPQQRQEAQDLIVRAFRQDPLLGFLTPDSLRQVRLLNWFAATGLAHGLRHGLVSTTSELSGLAVWFVPGQPAMTAASLFRAALWLPFQVGWQCFARFSRFVIYGDQVHRSIVTAPHWYLFILVVDPKRQGQGLGGSLLKPVLEKADATSQACYLETTNPRAVPFYRQHGFEVAHHSEPDQRSPSFWALRRPPALPPG